MYNKMLEDKINHYQEKKEMLYTLSQLYHRLNLADWYKNNRNESINLSI